MFKGYNYFRVNTKRDAITKRKYKEFLVLGPENLERSGLRNLVELLPAFCVYLYENELFDDEQLNDLSKYYICLA